MIEDIVFVTACMTYGGAQRIISNLSNAWVQKGIKVHLLSFEQCSESSVYPLSPLIDYRKLGSKYPETIPPNPCSHIQYIFLNYRRSQALKKELTKMNLKKETTILVSFLTQINLASILANSKIKLPIIVSERVYPKFSTYFIGRMARLWYYRYASFIVVLTSSTVSYFPKSWRKKIRVISNPVLPLKAEIQELELKKPFILAAGRLETQKRFDLLINSFAEVANHYPEWQLVILGEGGERQKLERLIQSFNLENRIQLLGVKSDIASYYANSNLFVLSSDFEGFPNVLAEAMSFGLPVISSDCLSGPSELIDSGENGILFRPGNKDELVSALHRTLSNEALRKSLGNQAKKVVERFSMDKILGQWDQLFADAMKIK